MFEIKTEDAEVAKKTLNEEFIWCEEVDDLVVEVFKKDRFEALDILADYNLLRYDRFSRL